MAKRALMRRWFLVGFFLATFLLCAGAWGVSYWRSVSASCGGGYSFALLLGEGSLNVWGGHWPSGRAEPFLMRVDAYLPDRLWLFYHDSRYHFLGFACEPNFEPSLTRNEWLAIIPLWFPTLLAAVGLVWGWRRKRRWDVTLKRGFPVGPPTDAREVQ